MNAARTAAIFAVLVIGGLLVSFVVRPPAVPQGSEPPAAGDAVAWNGVDWRQPPGPFAAGDPVPLRIDGLTAGPRLVVGWGRVAAQGRNQFHDMGAAFVTRDGERWRSIALDDGVGPQDTSEAFGVSIGPLGMLAYGGVCCATEERAFWHSVDGLRWTRLAIDGEFAVKRDWVARVVGLPTGWVAVGSSGEQAAIWTSADGRTWRSVDPAPAGLGRGSVADVALAGNQLIAVGTIDDAARTHDGGVWVSEDGIEWSRVALLDPALTGPDETELWRIVPHGAGLFLVGNHGPHEERVRCENLLGGMASLADRPPPETALSCGWGREHHWLSADAAAWLRLPPRDPLPGQPAPAEFRPNEFRLVAAGGAGIVNLAEDTQPPDGDSAIWVSADGRAWRRLDAVGPMRPAAGTPGFALLGRTIIAIAEADLANGLPPTFWIGRII